MEFCEVRPFESEEEQKNYCDMVGAQYEDGTVGFAMSDDYGNLGVCQVYTISNDVYIMGLDSDSGEESFDFLASGLSVIVSFFSKLNIRQISFPIKSSFQADVAEEAGFEPMSDTLYVYVFDSFKETDTFLDISDIKEEND